MKKRVLFYRDFRGFTGGHLKVWDYFQHVNSSNEFYAEIFMTRNSTWENNPWLPIKDVCLTKWNPRDSDILFLAGMDWLALSEEQRISPPSPVVNFIQGIRHANSNHPLHAFLKFPATRICVSEEVTNALAETGQVNGDIITNTNGIDLSKIPSPVDKDISLTIIGLKAPELATSLYRELLTESIDSLLITKTMYRKSFLSIINRSKIVVFFPKEKEGFYLPALEAMAMKTLVVCPDCIGNQSFCVDGESCFVPQYSITEIKKSIIKALSISKSNQETIINNAYDLACNYSIEKEREFFLQILSKLASTSAS